MNDPDPKPMTVLWSEARRSCLEGAAWNAALPKWDPPPCPTPKPKPKRAKPDPDPRPPGGTT